MRLVDDHRVVLGQGGAAVHGVDGQQGMVRDDEVGRSGVLPRLLDEAVRALWAVLHAETLPDWNGDLLPPAFGVTRRAVPVGQAVGFELVLGPLPQCEHLGPQG